MRRLFLLIILQMAMLSASVYAYEDLKLNYIPTNDSVKWCHLTPQGDIVLCGTKYGEDSSRYIFTASQMASCWVYRHRFLPIVYLRDSPIVSLFVMWVPWRA